MNPSDAMPKDYGMYYNGCWMRHSKLGVGRVLTDGSKMYLEFIKNRTSAVSVKPSYLTCWWPRPGAFNFTDHAAYIARRAIRNMRKSAVSGNHYFVKWGSPYGKEIMLTLRDGPNHVTMLKAIPLLKDKKMSSVAITRDIIIHLEDASFPDIYTVVFRGMEVGRLVHGCFKPSFSENPLTGRVLRQLEHSL